MSNSKDRDPITQAVLSILQYELKPIREAIEKHKNEVLYVRSTIHSQFEKQTEEKVERIIGRVYRKILGEYLEGPLFQRQVEDAVRKAIWAILRDPENEGGDKR